MGLKVPVYREDAFFLPESRITNYMFVSILIKDHSLKDIKGDTDGSNRNIRILPGESKYLVDTIHVNSFPLQMESNQDFGSFRCKFHMHLNNLKNICNNNLSILIFRYVEFCFKYLLQKYQTGTVNSNTLFQLRKKWISDYFFLKETHVGNRSDVFRKEWDEFCDKNKHDYKMIVNEPFYTESNTVVYGMFIERNSRKVFLFLNDGAKGHNQIILCDFSKNFDSDYDNAFTSLLLFLNISIFHCFSLFKLEDITNQT